MDKFSIGLIVGAIIMALFCNFTQFSTNENDDEVKVLVPINPRNCTTNFDTRDYIKKNHTLDIEGFVKAYYQNCD